MSSEEVDEQIQQTLYIVSSRLGEEVEAINARKETIPSESMSSFT